MATVFQMPKKLPSFPGKLPVFRIPSFANKAMIEQVLQVQLPFISTSVGFTTYKPLETKQQIRLEENALRLEYFKASGTFLFYDQSLVNREEPGLEILNPKKAKTRAIELLQTQGLLENKTPKGTFFNTFYGGAGYTMAQTAKIVNDDQSWQVAEESEPYPTEIRSHFGYLLNGLPVFGPGAKTIVSYVGNQISEEIHFWRPPIDMIGEQEIIAPATAMAMLAKDNRFTPAAALNKKKDSVSRGRFHDDVELGYYALPPDMNQRYYVPVYKIRGTFVSRTKVYGLKASSVAQSERDFRYDFEHFICALSPSKKNLYLSQFKQYLTC